MAETTKAKKLANLNMRVSEKALECIKRDAASYDMSTTQYVVYSCQLAATFGRRLQSIENKLDKLLEAQNLSDEND